ncbi:MAG: hypothetical protein IT305_01040 [Chloroflexi bacterium]|nr:hypothetical protein [Chloroflexota bacterium]
MRSIIRLVLAVALGIMVATGGLGLLDTFGAPVSVAHAYAKRTTKMTAPSKTGDDMDKSTCRWQYRSWLCDGKDGKTYVCKADFSHGDLLRP